MLVPLGTNVAISAGGTATKSYSPNSVQEVHIRWDDDSGTDAFKGFVTVQVGSKVIVAGVSMWGLHSMDGLSCNAIFTNTDAITKIDLGSHQLGPNENLFVTLSCASAITAADISAIVDEPLAGDMPIRYTEYSDKTFTVENVLMSTCYGSDYSAIDTDDKNITVKTASYSSSPTFSQSGVAWQSQSVTNYQPQMFGLLSKNQIPMDTSFNYVTSSNVDRIMVAEAMPRTAFGRIKAKESANVAIQANSKRMVQK